jgi:SAM-dependent methyltransferase
MSTGVTNRYSILVVRPPGYVHSEAFREVADSLELALRALGQDVCRSDLPVPGRRPIVLGSNLLAHHPIELPAESILYNLEQIDGASAWLTRPMLDLFRRHQVWDCSPVNAARYRELGLPPPKVVPIGYVPELSRIPSEEAYRVISARDLRPILAEALGLDLPTLSPHTTRSDMDTAVAAPAVPRLPANDQFDRPEVVARVQPAGRRILDVGCAAGAMGAAMLSAGATEVAGIEIHAPAAAIARGRLTSVYGYDLDTLPELPYPARYFDVITLADVLEHLRDPLAVLRHLRRWLADDGQIVCSLGNVRHESVLLPLLVEGRWDYAEAGILDRTHLRFFTMESMQQLLRAAGFEPDGRVEGVRTPPSPQLELAAVLVEALGGDAQRFRSEAQVIQVILSARPLLKAGARPDPILDPWRGSRPVRILVAPDVADPADHWTETLTAVVDGLGPCEGVTVGVALPLPLLDPPPAALLPVAERSGIDLLLTEAPGDEAGWERMLAGASIWIATSDHPPLQQLATRIGLQVQDLSGLRPDPRPATAPAIS